jgi:hypothetical protein
MEEREHAEGHVAGRQMEEVVDRPHVRADVLLGEHHPLRIPRGARGEDDRERIVGPDPVEAKRRLQHPQRHQPRLHECDPLVHRRRLLPQRSRVEQPLPEFELHAAEERRARDHVPQAGPLDADVEDRLARRVVEVHGHAAREGQGRVHDRPAHRRRQHHPDPLLVGRQHAVEHPLDDEDREQEIAAAQPRAERIGHLHPAAGAAARPQHLPLEDDGACGRGGDSHDPSAVGWAAGMAGVRCPGVDGH